MSYILDALKKSDQQRQRGATPTLPEAPVTVASPKQTLFTYYGLFAVALLGAGITIGWLHPWQAEQPAHAAEPGAASLPISISNQGAPTPLSEPPEMTKTAQALQTPNATPVAQPSHRVDAIQPGISAPVRGGISGVLMQETPASPVDTAQEQKAIPLAELPLTLQQEIPVMTVQLHAYSSKAMNRIVSINSRMLHEGESLMPGLRLEQVTPDGVIFSYKGYRFQHGIR